MSAHHIKTDYLQNVYNPNKFTDLVKKSIATANFIMSQVHFDSIVFTGSSGAAMAFILSIEMNIPLIHIRKRDGSHYLRYKDKDKNDSLIEGFLESKRYIFLDDMISSGETFRNVLNIMYEVQPKSECVGAFMYNYDHRDCRRLMHIEGQSDDGRCKTIIKEIEVPMFYNEKVKQTTFANFYDSGGACVSW